MSLLMKVLVPWLSLGYSLLLFQILSPMCLAQGSDTASRIYASSSASVFSVVDISRDGETISEAVGFVIDDGKILTNERAVRHGIPFINIGTIRLPAVIEKSDTLNDLAILKLMSDLKANPLSLAKTIPEPGTMVFAIGKPVNLGKSVCAGTVSGFGEFEGRQLIQLTCPITPNFSGGPILNKRGEVVGIALGGPGMDQKIGYAVPTTVALKWLRGEINQTQNIKATFARMDPLLRLQDQLDYSSDKWEILNQQIDQLLSTALDAAADNYNSLLQLSERAHGRNIEIEILAARRAAKSKPTAEANLILAKAIKTKAMLSDDTDKASLLEQAEKSIRACLKSTKRPTAEMYYVLADILEDRGSYAKAETMFGLALEGSKGADEEIHANSIRGFIRITDLLGKNEESEQWFKSLLNSGQVSWWDWQSKAQRMLAAANYSEAGKDYYQAAILGDNGTDWCGAAKYLSESTVRDQDKVLISARKCIEISADKKDAVMPMAAVHLRIARILNGRGDSQEALKHALEATLLDPSNFYSFYYLSISLEGVGRLQGAIDAAKKAIRLSDDRQRFIYSQLGSLYFKARDWDSARLSYEMAAKLQPKNDEPAYNVALCYERLGNFAKAAKWYKEVLHRNPHHPERDFLLTRIRIWRF